MGHPRLLSPTLLTIKKWQQLWVKNLHKFFQVQSILKERKLDPNIRREGTTLAWLHIEHTRLTHSFILKRGNQYFIKHILIECTKLTYFGRRFYNVDNMNTLFRKIVWYFDLRTGQKCHSGWCTGRRWHILMAVMRGNRVGGNWLMKWDEVKKFPWYTHRLMHRKRVTCELHDSYFRLMTIKHAISKIE